MISPQQVETMIQTSLPNAQVQVVGDGEHFEAIVVSADFAGETTSDGICHTASRNGIRGNSRLISQNLHSRNLAGYGAKRLIFKED